jgi:hypothetical protein
MPANFGYTLVCQNGIRHAGSLSGDVARILKGGVEIEAIDQFVVAVEKCWGEVYAGFKYWEE